MSLIVTILAAIDVIAAWCIVAWFAFTWWAHPAPEDRL